MTSKVDQIFVRANANQRERTQFVTLRDGFRLALRTQYVARVDQWSLWVLDLAGVQVLGPVVLVRGVSLLRPYTYSPSVPSGQLWISGDVMTLATADVTSRLLYRPAT